MRHYDELASYDRDGFLVIVDKTWEDIPLRDMFDDTCYDIRKMERQVNAYELDWFMLRVRVLLDGHELGSQLAGRQIARVCPLGRAAHCAVSVLRAARRIVTASVRWARLRGIRNRGRR